MQLFELSSLIGMGDKQKRVNTASVVKLLTSSLTGVVTSN